MSFTSSLRVFLVDVISITKANCAQPMNYYTSMLLVLVGLKVVLLLLLIIPLVWDKLSAFRRLKAVRTAARGSVRAVNWLVIFKTSFMLLFVAYPGRKTSRPARRVSGAA